MFFSIQAAQVDSVNMLCSAKVNANAESSVGLLTMAGSSAALLVSSTRDLGRVFTSLHDVKFDGLSNFIAGIQKAQLALKHRQNAHQRQRIIVFVTSPIEVPQDKLIRLGKNLKKNNVAVDIINIGLEGDNVEKIDGFIAAVNSGENSHALHVQAGSQNLVEALMQSEIYIDRDGAVGVGTEAAASSAAGGANAAEFPYGVDPSVDPELAMVLRISMEEEQARQAAAREAEQKNAKPTETGDAAAASSTAAPASDQQKGAVFDDDDGDLYGTGAAAMDIDGDEEAMLQAAIEMSKKDAEEFDKKDDKKE